MLTQLFFGSRACSNKSKICPGSTRTNPWHILFLFPALLHENDETRHNTDGREENNAGAPYADVWDDCLDVCLGPIDMWNRGGFEPPPMVVPHVALPTHAAVVRKEPFHEIHCRTYEQEHVSVQLHGFAVLQEGIGTVL